MKLSIIGTGYVGLISGVCLAAKGHEVTCYDNNREIIDLLNNGSPHIYEQGLKELLASVLEKKKFKAKLISDNTNFDSKLILVAVGTPSTNGKIDLSYIQQVSESLGKYIKINKDYISIVIKSTVVPGTTDTVVRKIIEESSGKKFREFGLGMNPEFLREGNAIEDFMKPDRIVFGHDDEITLERLENLYKPWNCDKISVNTRTAEMIKYANNSLLATQISAVNELANIASAIEGIDILDVMKGVHMDKRWSPILNGTDRIYPDILSYLIPGCGFGGSCFPKDVEALRNKSYEVGVEPHIIDSVLKVNENQPFQIVKLLKDALIKFKNKKILFLGLAFKPDTDDVRESIAIKIINKLLKYETQIYAHDPIAIENAKVVINNKNLQYIENWESTLNAVDAIVLTTKWDEYEKLSLINNKDNMIGKIFVDARRLFQPTDFPHTIYLTVGRKIND